VLWWWCWQVLKQPSLVFLVMNCRQVLQHMPVLLLGSMK